MRKIRFGLIIIIIVMAICPLTAIADEHKTLIVGDDSFYPPYAYLDENGEPTGFNVEISKALGRVLGYEVEFQLDHWHKVREALENGDIDMISGMFYSPEREDLYSFSLRHTLSIGDIFTRKGLQVRSIEDLRGQTVIVQRGDITAEYLATLDLDIRLIEVASPREALQLIEDGSYDYAGVLQIIGHYIIKEDNLTHVQSQNLTINTSDYGFAVKKGNEDLLLEINSGLQILKLSGEYDEIYGRWIGVYEEVHITDLLYQYRWIPPIFLAILSFFIISTYYHKKLVRKKTAELEENNELLLANSEELEANLEELSAVEEELREQYDKLLQQERALTESEERFKRIIRAFPDLVFVFNKDGVIKDVQAPDEDSLLIPKSTFLNKNLKEIMPLAIAEPAIEKIQKALTTCDMEYFEYKLPDKEGFYQSYEIRFVKSNQKEVIGFARNISSEKEYLERIEYLSFHDRLTGLFNRHSFEEELINIDKPEHLPVCLVMLDVNGLKLVNDSLGHQIGDKLLVKVADVLNKACRDEEKIYRIGGDEFAVLFTMMGTEHPEQLIRRIFDSATGQKVNNIELSISVGWDCKTNSNQELQEVFKNAENNMYKQKLFEAPSMRGKIIHAIINTLHEKNKREEAHSRRVSELAQALAEALGMTEGDVKEIQTMGLLHDIGKVAIDDSILNKEGKLTREEYEEIKLHPEIGYRILSSVNDMAEMAEYVLYHHEKWDGSGYPKGIKEDAIPLQARIIGIVDAYDAMISERSYRESLTVEEAVAELRKWSGKQFDPVLVEIFIKEVLGYKQT